MRLLLSLLLILSSLAFTADAQRRRKSSAAKPAPKQIFTIKGDADKPGKAPVNEYTREVIEKYASSYELNADGTGTETRELIESCSAETCLHSIASFKQIYNGNLEKMRILEAYVLKPDGSRVKLPASSITDRVTDQAEAAPGFSSMREIEAKFDGVKVGDSVYVKAERVTTKPTFEKRYDALEMFPLLYDWKSIEINVTAPSDFPLFLEATGLEGGKLTDENGRARWQYKKSNLARIDIEPAMFDVMTISPRFALTTYPDADALGAVFWQNAKSRTVVTPEIQTLADEITKGVATPSEQAAAIYDWVNRNIRYLSIVLDRGGWVPHSASEIIQNRYGDCKDYTTVIHTLLKAKGIDSTPVLIRSDFGDWFPSVPTADFFNHLILYIPSLNVFADATTPNTRLGLIPQTIVGKRGVLAGEKTGVVQLPKDNPADNQLLSDLTVDFADNGSLKGRSRNTYVGRSEIIFRPLFASSVIKQQSETFVKMLLAYSGIDGEGNIVSVSNPHKVGEPFLVELETRVGNYTTFLPKGRVELPPGLNMMSMASMEGLVTTETRKTNVVAGAVKMRESVTINFPASVKLTQAPAAVKFSNAIGSLSITSEIKDGSLRHSREFVLTKDIVEPKDYPLLKELIGKLLDTGTIAVDYTADPSLLKAKSKELSASAVKSKPVASAISPAMLQRVRMHALTTTDLQVLEKKLTIDPENREVRFLLIHHYSGQMGPIDKSKLEPDHVRHRLWLINNHPEISDDQIYGLSRPTLSDASIELLKKAWTTKVEENKDSTKIRSNAIAALRDLSPETAESFAEEIIKREPDDYQGALLIVGIYADVMNKKTTADASDRAAKKVLEYGKQALELIKKERSEERDSDRAQLLTDLCTASIKRGELDAATSFAQELVLDFGQASSEWSYDQSTHVGNTTLGLIELRRNNVAKAKEHLLAAIRAPLRQGYNNLLKIDMRLAAELLDKGEKGTVVEYLTLCMSTPNFKQYPESYANELYALQLWIEQIGKGIRPNFDFSAPESKKPLQSVKPNVKIVRAQE